MLHQLSRGSGYVLKGFRLIRRPGIRRYVLVPFLINLVLFGSAIGFGYAQFSNLLDWMLPSWLDWARWILWPVFAITVLIVVFYTFTLVANLIGAPFNALLAEKLEASLTGRPLAETKGVSGHLANVGTALGNELRKLLYLAVWIIPLLILFLIPGVNAAAPFAWMAFSAWMLALEYADYPMGNHDMRFKDERGVLRQHRWMALGFGAGILLMTLVPVLNFLAMPVGVAGATAMWVERLREPTLAGPN